MNDADDNDPTPDLIDALAKKIVERGSIEKAARELGIDEDLLDAWREVGAFEESGPCKDLADAVDAAIDQLQAEKEPHIVDLNGVTPDETPVA
jgi:hypothetical protein